jgi:cysteine desulfurase/selenocysteine lyase
MVSFVMDHVHPHDIGTIFDQWGVAIRTGHHCARPLMNLLKVPATARISLGLYNTAEDIDKAVTAIAEIKKVFVL